MLHLSLLVVFIGVCLGLAIGGTVDKANTWNVVLGLVCLVVGALMERLRFQNAERVIESQKRFSQSLSRDRSRTMPAGFLWMLLTAGCVLLGLILLMFQAMAYLWS